MSGMQTYIYNIGKFADVLQCGVSAKSIPEEKGDAAGEMSGMRADIQYYRHEEEILQCGVPFGTG